MTELLQGVEVFPRVLMHATQWDGSAVQARLIVQWATGRGQEASYEPPETVGVGTTSQLSLKVRDAWQYVDPGDWIVDGAGQLTICPADELDHHYIRGGWVATEVGVGVDTRK